MDGSVRFRRYEDGDTDALLALDEWAIRDAGTDPDDIPGSDDLRAIPASYLETGGDFVVGIRPNAAVAVADEPPETHDGYLVAMGGFLPAERGYDDERSVARGAELHRMRVAPPSQGEGYGRELLGELEGRAVESGFELLLVTTALRQRRAVAFYRRAGYDEVDRSEYGEYELVHFEKRVEGRQ